MIREAMHYRRDVFCSGLQAAGYELHERIVDPKPGDIVCVWNRYGVWSDEALRFERRGAAAVIAENSYIQGETKRFALARSFHNDSTVVPDGGPERWHALNIDLMPWRTSGEHVLVCPNRSFGTPGRIMPGYWGQDVCQRLAKVTKREIRLRPHPGNKPAEKPLADDLVNAWCTVIWSSSAGVHSLIAGVPVVSESPFWICKSAAGAAIADVESPPMPDRLAAMQRLAWAVWSVDEISSGEAFRRLL